MRPSEVSPKSDWIQITRCERIYFLLLLGSAIWGEYLQWQNSETIFLRQTLFLDLH